MKKKSVNLVFLFLLLAVGCSQETVMNGSISGKTNASDTKMSINIVTETSRTVRPAVTKWEITVTNKEEENNLEYSKTVDSKTTSVIFINIVATTTYTVEVHGLDEDGNKILSGTKEKVQIEANKVNICNVTVSDDFEADKSDKNGRLSVNINGLGELGIQENSNFTLKMSGSTNSNNYKNVELTYENGVLSGLESDILPGSYKISIADFPVNVIQDPIVNIYPGAVTTIDWTWNYNDEECQKQVGDNIKQKNTLIPVWNKNADGGDTVGLIGANGLFVTPTWEDGTFVACDTDDAGDMWTLIITETAINEDGSKTNTYKLTNEHAKESYYFEYNLQGDNGLGHLYKRQLVDFCVAEIDLLQFITEPKEENFYDEDGGFMNNDFNDAREEYNNKINDVKEMFGGETKQKILFILSSTNQIYTCFIDSLIKKEGDLPFSLDNNDIFSNYITSQNLSEVSFNKLSTIEVVYEECNDVFGFYLYVGDTVVGKESEDSSYYSYYQNIYKIKILGILDDVPLTNNDGTISSPRFTCKKISREEYTLSAILTLDMGDYFTDNTGNTIKFFNEAFKISDMHVVGNDLYITAGCVSYNKDATDNHQYFSYSFGGLFRYENVSMFYYDGKSEEYSFPEGYSWNDDIKKVEGLKINHVYGLKEMDNQSENVWIVKNEQSGESLSNTLIGLTQAETDDSQYFAGPRYIIPSDDKLFIIDSGFYGEYSESEITGADGTTTNGVTFTLKDKRNRIFTFDTTDNSLSFSPIDDGILFDYDYITRTDPFESNGYDSTKETVSW